MHRGWWQNCQLASLKKTVGSVMQDAFSVNVVPPLGSSGTRGDTLSYVCRQLAKDGRMSEKLEDIAQMQELEAAYKEKEVYQCLQRVLSAEPSRTKKKSAQVASNIPCSSTSCSSVHLNARQEAHMAIRGLDCFCVWNPNRKDYRETQPPQPDFILVVIR
jgi:hypothetical protein